MNVFYGCENLVDINLPEGLEKIDTRAFYDCPVLKQVSLPSTLKSVGSDAFNTSDWTSIVIPEGMENIGKNAFSGCKNIVDVEFNAVNCGFILGASPFPQTIKTIRFGDKVETIPGCLLQNCAMIESVSLPESVISIGGDSFMGCKALTKLVIPDKVTSIDVEAFAYCDGLQEVSLGKCVEKIGLQAFAGCSSLRILRSNNPVPPSAAKGCFADIDKQACGLYVPSESVDRYAKADEWGQFANINTEVSAVYDVIADSLGLEICINGTSLYVIGSEGKEVQIFGVDGRCEWQTASYGGEAVELQPGIHIVRVGDNTLKVSL